MKPHIRSERSERSDDGFAFVPDVGALHERLADEDAESFGEEFVAAAISGDSPFEEHFGFEEDPLR